MSGKQNLPAADAFLWRGTGVIFLFPNGISVYALFYGDLHHVGPVAVYALAVSKIPIGFHTDIPGAFVQRFCHGTDGIGSMDAYLEVSAGEPIGAGSIAHGISFGSFGFTVQPYFHISIGYGYGLDTGGLWFCGASLGGGYIAEDVIPVSISDPGTNG